MNHRIKIYSTNQMNILVGPHDVNLKLLNRYLKVKIELQNDELIINGDDDSVMKAKTALTFLIKLIDSNVIMTERDIVYIIKLSNQAKLDDSILDLYKNRTKILFNNYGKPIYPKTFNQKRYVDLIDTKDLVFAIGPAGTGKTYLAVAKAVEALKKNKVKKVILTRPAVEAGEQLGFLPGDLKEKIDPYLIPLYDALAEFLGKQNMKELIEKEIIEIAPLAYMRGRTLENAFVILDEAQNASSTQLKMFLTRLGFNSKMIITGDPSQTDLRKIEAKMLIDVTKMLDRLSEIGLVNFDNLDVSRPLLVQKILDIYDEIENKNP